jgi:hypothetical protein
MVDDDDTPNTAPASNVPAGQGSGTPTEKPEGEKPEGEPETEEVTTTDEDDVGDADDEQDDEDDDDEDEGDEAGESEGEEKPKPKRAERTRLQRYREQAERLKAENEALRSRNQQGAPPSDAAQLQRALEYAVWQEIGDPPSPDDFKDDYVALSIARQAYETDRRQVARAVRKQFEHSIRIEQERVATLVAEHKERVANFRTKVKDYAEVMAKATLPVAPHVERLLLHSKKSERLGYVLARNENKLAQLNRMDPESAAREIGRLEGRLSLPTPKQQTQARKPITPLKGGGAAPPTGLAAVNAYIKKQYGDRA